MFWFSKKCRCEKSVIDYLDLTPPKACPVSPTSPAYILADSLTSVETRGEWSRSYDRWLSGCYGSMMYVNKSRDIYVSRNAGYGHEYEVLVTPFTLSQAEERIVLDALQAFDAYLGRKREADVLSRLVNKPPAGED